MLFYIEFSRYGKVFPEHQVAYFGGKTSIACHSASIPTWKKDGEVLSIHSRQLKTIILRNIRWSNAGNYTCIGTNKDGESFEAYSELVVASKIIILKIFLHQNYYSNNRILQVVGEKKILMDGILICN